jgi:hypothetical protein
MVQVAGRARPPDAAQALGLGLEVTTGGQAEQNSRKNPAPGLPIRPHIQQKWISWHGPAKVADWNGNISRPVRHARRAGRHDYPEIVVLRLAHACGTRSSCCPDRGQSSLLAKPRFVLKPDFDRLAGMLAGTLIDLFDYFFLKSS